MAKLGDFYVSALDFFGTMLPGAVTLGAAIILDIPAHWPSIVTAGLVRVESRIGAFLVVAYVVGQISNSVGSLLLDLIYDVLYDPKHGWLSKPALQAEDQASWFEHTFGLYDRGTEARRIRLRDELEHLVHGPVTGAVSVRGAIKGVYQTVRAYLKIASPEAFGDLEKLEGEQKFFRSLTIGTIAVTLCLVFTSRSIHEESTALLLAFALLLFLRYVGVRRKTVERAYVYFSLRASFAGSTATRGREAANE